MRYFSLFHCFFLALLSSGVDFCTKDCFDGPESRLLVKAPDAPDDRYAPEGTVYLGRQVGSTATVDVNTNYQWYIDDSSLYAVPHWCAISLPSEILTGNVADKSLTFTVKSNNEHPFNQGFDLVLRHAADTTVKVTIRIVQQ